MRAARVGLRAVDVITLTGSLGVYSRLSHSLHVAENHRHSEAVNVCDARAGLRASVGNEWSEAIRLQNHQSFGRPDRREVAIDVFRAE